MKNEEKKVNVTEEVNTEEKDGIELTDEELAEVTGGESQEVQLRTVQMLPLKVQVQVNQ